MLAPVVHQRPEAGMRQQPVFPARAATREAVGRQQHQGRGRQQRQHHADQTNNQAQKARQQPESGPPARTQGEGRTADGVGVRRRHGRCCWHR